MNAIEVRNLAALQRVLRSIVRYADDLTPLAQQLGQTLQQQTIQRFVVEKDPEGIPWIKSRRALKEGNQTLTDTGRLRGSITYSGDNTGATVLTTVGYGVDHQIGIAPNPRRAFMGLNAENEAEILDIALRYLIEAASR